jgi:hypothetical protein
VSWRRSAEDDDGASSCVGSGDVSGNAASAGAEGAPAVSLLPQSAQNFALGGLLCPQARHATGNDAPHSMQNRLPFGRSALQIGHSMPHLNLQ